MKYYIENTNGQTWNENGTWSEAGTIYAKEFTRDELIDFEDTETGCDYRTYFDNSMGGSINIGWADDDGEILAQAIEVK